MRNKERFEMAIVTRTHASAIICLLAFSAVQPGFCDEDFIHDAAEFGGPSGGVVRSDQMLELGVTTSNGLRLEGEQCLRLGNVDRAVQLLQRALEMSPADMDGRILYATALEKKLTKQKKKDPKLFNF